MMRPIHIGFSPNLEEKDVLLALRLLFLPKSWFHGESVKKLEEWFYNFFPSFSAISFVSGRGALYAALNALGVGKNDEVILQAFTCAVVPNAVTNCGAKPVYADITDSLTLDPKSIEKNITKATKAIIVQHTFGIPSEMEEICKIAKKHNLAVVEDCAHTIGGIYKGKKLGMFGDAAIFSFGRDKAFSSVFGGMAIAKDKAVVDRLRSMQQVKSYPSTFWLVQQLLHPIASGIILPLYNFFGIGKVILVLLQKTKLLSFPVLLEEKNGATSPIFMQKMPNALAELALFQLSRLLEFNKKREETTSFYVSAFGGGNSQQQAPLLRFPLFVNNRNELLQSAKKQHLYLGTWYSEVIDPKSVNFEKMHYVKGSCPNAEKIANKIINLPTYPTMSKDDQKKVINFIKTYVRNS